MNDIDNLRRGNGVARCGLVPWHKADSDDEELEALEAELVDNLHVQSKPVDNLHEPRRTVVNPHDAMSAGEPARKRICDGSRWGRPACRPLL